VNNKSSPILADLKSKGKMSSTRLVSTLLKPGNMQYGNCPKEIVVAGQADVSLQNEGACAEETFDGVEFPRLEIEFVPTKELLRRLKEMERREMELIRMWLEAEKVYHETNWRWKGMVKFVRRELQELRC
jgi:hypothetical protein